DMSSPLVNYNFFAAPLLTLSMLCATNWANLRANEDFSRLHPTAYAALATIFSLKRSTITEHHLMDELEQALELEDACDSPASPTLRQDAAALRARLIQEGYFSAQPGTNNLHVHFRKRLTMLDAFLLVVGLVYLL